MTSTEYINLQNNCRAHPFWKKDWSSYYSIKFADTFLPKAKLFISKGLRIYDGAEIFKDISKCNNETFTFTNKHKLIHIVTYTYPKGVLAQERKNTVQAYEDEICLFAEIEQNDKIDIYFKFGKQFKTFLQDYLKDIDATINVTKLEATRYRIDKTNIEKIFSPNLQHLEMMQFIFNILNINSAQVKSRRKRFIEEVEWHDKKGLIKLSSPAKGIVFGEKVKLVIKGKRLKQKNPVKISIGIQKDRSKPPYYPNDLIFTVTPQNNKAETPFFKLEYDWFDESKEKYDYKKHITEIDVKELTVLSAKFNIKRKEFFTKRKENLVPSSYLRNYEELIGLFEEGNMSGNKSTTNNYENKYISENNEIKQLVDKFIDFVFKIESISNIKQRIAADASKLWEFAVKQVQADNLLDDRPLYWARNKMQATLKRHHLFKNDINMVESIVKSGTKLSEIITIFEENSRNYTGIDFSKAKPDSDKIKKAEEAIEKAKQELKDAQNLPESTDDEKKAKKKAIKKAKDAVKQANDNLEKAKKVYKVLVTGFDPFQLNSINHLYKKWYNIRQANPSGIVALALDENNELGAHIQTMIFPVRYTDFDGSEKNNTGQGEGVVEKYIRPLIDKVDMIITVSQAGEDEYHIDVFATATRGGSNDNMNFTRINGSKSVSNTAPETIKTTLPIQMTQGHLKSVYWGIYQKNGIKRNATISTIPSGKVYRGPGGNYLSNEIFYRVAKMRSEMRPTLKTGHFHISKIQDAFIQEDLKPQEIKKLLIIVKQTLIEGFKTL